MKTPIIYAIRNIASGRVYVGSTTSATSRWKAHRHNLRNGRHHSPTLQRSWDKHGADAFSFEVLEKVDDVGRLLEREQHWIDELRAADPDLGFNVSPVAGTRRGVPQPPSVADTLRKVHAGKAKAAEHRTKIGDAQRGRVRSKEANRKTSEGLRRYWANPEHRAAQSARRKGAPNAMKGKTHSEAAVARMRAGVAKAIEADPSRIGRLRDMASAAGKAAAANGGAEKRSALMRQRWAENRDALIEARRMAREARAASGLPARAPSERQPHSEETKAKMRAAWARRKAAKEAACPTSSPTAQSPGPA